MQITCQAPADRTRHARCRNRPAIIRDWWQRWPWANIGVVGADVFFLDIDVKKGKRGDVILEQLIAEHKRATGYRTAVYGQWRAALCIPPADRPENRQSHQCARQRHRYSGHNGYIVAEPSIAIDRAQRANRPV